MATSKAKTIPRWPAATATSLGVHLAALMLATSGVPPRPSDPKIEIDVLPAQQELRPAPSPEHEASAPSGGDGVAKPRPAMARSAVSRLVRTRASVAARFEAPVGAQIPEPAAFDPPSADSVTVATAAASQGTVASPDPALAGPRMGPPKTVAPAVGDGLLAINPNDPRYQPIVPQPLRKPGATFLTRLKFCVTADGSVDKVTVITASEATLDNAIVEKARLYRFHPYFDQGRPIPFCFYREYHLSIQD